jgi:hypothetical protein
METQNIDIGKKISAKRTLGATQIDSKRIKTKNFPHTHCISGTRAPWGTTV